MEKAGPAASSKTLLQAAEPTCLRGSDSPLQGSAWTERAGARSPHTIEEAGGREAPHCLSYDGLHTRFLSWDTWMQFLWLPTRPPSKEHSHPFQCSHPPLPPKMRPVPRRAVNGPELCGGLSVLLSMDRDSDAPPLTPSGLHRDPHSQAVSSASGEERRCLVLIPAAISSVPTMDRAPRRF